MAVPEGAKNWPRKFTGADRKVMMELELLLAF
jgi:hypothetical protein